ncbi:tetratricopeptide repeat protein [Pleionea sp. CnH1-48]|uniref:tetratricopeptide repeat protein n=1 Tax=Pleionea sp. CnH1-48 TaxID=2954494 RepID=UPI0020981ABB|nr:tetratricopeptide repeat protein [Pleionea sp. CnH1-48]MCO7223834.1 tetratricopeptide repeat protein [Pleionea sp. CnH1-48]
MKFIGILVLVCILAGCAGKPTTKGYVEGESLIDKIKEANHAYEEARLDKAETLFLGITKEKPGYLNGWLKLGNIYVRQGRYKAAVRCFNEAIKLDKEDGRAWYNLALTRVKQAVDVLETAEKVVPVESEHQVYFLDLHTRLEKRMREKTR